MEFLAGTQLDNSRHPLSGTQLSQRDRFRTTVEWAVFAEDLGFDAIGVDERHGPPFLSSSPAVLLGHLAAVTRRVRLLAFTPSFGAPDPVRTAEDYATLDHLSDGRVELVLGDDASPSLPQPSEDHQRWYRRHVERLRGVWATAARPNQPSVVQPVPLQEPTIPLWYGGEAASDLAAEHGGRLFTVAGLHTVDDAAAGRVRRYRQRWEKHQRDPADAVVGVACAGLYVTRSSQDAIGTFRPYYHALLRRHGVARAPFPSLSESIVRGPLLVGSPQQVVEKAHQLHDVFGHQVLRVDIEGVGVPRAQQRSSLELFFSEVVPVLRRELPSAVWGEPAPARWPREVSTGPLRAAR